jgi:hypothetical protein
MFDIAQQAGGIGRIAISIGAEANQQLYEGRASAGCRAAAKHPGTAAPDRGQSKGRGADDQHHCIPGLTAFKHHHPTSNIRHPTSDN